MAGVQSVDLATRGVKGSSRVLEGLIQPGNGKVSKCTPQEFVKLLTLGVHPGVKGSTVDASDFKRIIANA